MPIKTFRHALILTLVLGVTLACTALSGVREQIKEAQGTVGAVVTQAEGIATAVTTAKAIATEAAPLIKTAEAIATQNPGIEKTALAMATQIGFGEAPPDIPLLSKEQMTNLFASRHLVSYTALLGFAEVVGFYESEMPKNEWAETDLGKLETDTVWMRTYEKPGRAATVTITVANDQVLVAIVIVAK